MSGGSMRHGERLSVHDRWGRRRSNDGWRRRGLKSISNRSLHLSLDGIGIATTGGAFALLALPVFCLLSLTLEKSTSTISE
jgi:hypothetical protein